MHRTPLLLQLPCACTSLRKAARAVSRVYDEALGKAGLTTAQFSILYTLGRVGASGVPLSRLAEQLVMDRTSLYRALQPLARGGFVVVEGGPSGRSKSAFLTEEGQRKTAAAAPLWEEVQARVVGEFGSSRWNILAPELAELTRVASDITN